MRPSNSTVLPVRDTRGTICVHGVGAVALRVDEFEVLVGGLDDVGDLVLSRTVEHRRRDVHRTLRIECLALGSSLHPTLCRPAEVRLEQLADVHSARNAERVQDDVDRRAVGEERHVLDRKYLGDDTLVAVPTRELVALLDLALLSDVHAHEFVDPWRQVVSGFTAELAHRDDATGLAVRHLERRVAYLASLLAEDRAQVAAPRPSARSRPSA